MGIMRSVRFFNFSFVSLQSLFSPFLCLSSPSPRFSARRQSRSFSLFLCLPSPSPTTKEEILASYDFQSTCTVGSSPPRTSGDTGTATAGGWGSTWGSLGSRTASSNVKVRQHFNYRSLFLFCVIFLSFLGSFELLVEFGLIIIN